VRFSHVTKEPEDHITWGLPIDGIGELPEPGVIPAGEPLQIPSVNYPPADPNSDVEAADQEPFDIANPFELTITQGPKGAAPIFKFLVQGFYLSMLLFIPRLYFSRVERILRNAQMSLEDMEHMFVVGLGKWNRKRWNSRIPVFIQNSPMYPAFMQFSLSWEFFIDSLMEEWKTFNIVSVLLSAYVLFSGSSPNAEMLMHFTSVRSLRCFR
jgi:hypothetical protein